MKDCLNCYNSWMCKMKTPEFYKEHFENGVTCFKWEDDSVDWDSDWEDKE